MYLLVERSCGLVGNSEMQRMSHATLHSSASIHPTLPFSSSRLSSRIWLESTAMRYSALTTSSLRNSQMETSDHKGAIQSFERARSQMRSSVRPHLSAISLDMVTQRTESLLTSNISFFSSHRLGLTVCEQNLHHVVNASRLWAGLQTATEVFRLAANPNPDFGMQLTPPASIKGRPPRRASIIPSFFLFLFLPFFLAFFALCSGSSEWVAFDDDAVPLDTGGLVVRDICATFFDASDGYELPRFWGASEVINLVVNEPGGSGSSSSNAAATWRSQRRSPGIRYHAEKSQKYSSLSFLLPTIVTPSDSVSACSAVMKSPPKPEILENPWNFFFISCNGTVYIVALAVSS
ncbi:hypothetical protein OG21DRAFT_1578032 [Imleria badia]|nr:hypothetical protein OG21DRAFT_1578032 [Imleria badia]